MANKSTNEIAKQKAAMRLAETTDVSPKQAKDLQKKHGDDSKAIKKEARNYKAEG